MYVHRNARDKDKTKNPNRKAIRRENCISILKVHFFDFQDK